MTTEARSYTEARYSPDPGDVAYICTKPSVDEFVREVPAIILNESYHGCGLAIGATTQLQEGDLCLSQVGRLDPMLAKVVWRHVLDETVVRIGLAYEDNVD